MASNLGIFSVGLATYGAVTSASGAFFAQRSEAVTNELNASLTQANETIKQAAAGVEIEKLQEQKDAFTGAQVAKVAKSGMKLSGSPLKVIEDSIKNFNRDITMLRINASVSQASADQTSQVYNMQARYNRRLAYYSASSQLVSGLGNIGLQLYKGD